MEVFLHQRKSLLLTLLGQRQNCNAIDNSDRLNIRKYLMVKNNIIIFRHIKQMFLALLSFRGSVASIVNTPTI